MPYVIFLLLLVDLGMSQTIVTNLVRKEPGSAQLRPLVWREPVAEATGRFTPGRFAGRANVAIASTSAVLAASDKLLLDTVRKRWLDLLANASKPPQSASVILEFEFHPNGKVTGLRTLGEPPQDKVFALMATRAVLDPAPYPKWADGTESRTICLKFSLRESRDKPNDASLDGISY
jgi:hypothetical protein